MSNNERQQSQPERNHNTGQIVVPLIAALVASGALGGNAASRSDHSSTPSPEASTIRTLSPAEYSKVLKHELSNAYSKVTIGMAKDTGKQFIDPNGIHREAISIHIDSAVNHAIADDKTTPEYTYSSEPVETAVMPDGFKLPGDIQWADQKAGDATMNVGLPAFEGSKPVTVDYHVGLGVYGADNSGHMIDGIYNAGDIYVKGANGKVTSVEVTPQPSATDPSVQIIELQGGEDSRVPS